MARTSAVDHTRWEDDHLSEHGCFAWLSAWACAPTHTIVGVMGLYKQLIRRVLQNQTN